MSFRAARPFQTTPDCLRDNSITTMLLRDLQHCVELLGGFPPHT